MIYFLRFVIWSVFVLSCSFQSDVKSSWDVRGDGETLVLGSSRSLDCGGLIHNTSCPAPPSQQEALRQLMGFLFGFISSRPPGAKKRQFCVFPNLCNICGSCEERGAEKKMQIRLQGNYSRCGRQNFSGFFLLGFRPNPSGEGF